MDYIIHQERPEEYALVENLTREAFWNVYRPGCSEHYILHCFRERDEFIPELDLVMEQDGRDHRAYHVCAGKDSDGNRRGDPRL